MKRRKFGLFPVAALCAAAFAGTAGAPTATATPTPGPDAIPINDQILRNATGFQNMGSFTVSFGGQTFNVPGGCALGHTIRGNGKRIDKEWASWTCGPPASSYLLLHKAYCNPRMDFVYYNGNGKEYSRKRGTTKYKCYGSEGPTWYGTARTLPVYGRACAKLYLNGSLKATQCHNIQP